MNHRPMRVAAIHDLSGFGRCSLTVILPVLSAMGVQACPVPTAVFSTHLGGLGEVAYRDLTDFMEPALAHYRQLDIGFEAIYSGFLSTENQIGHCLAFLESYPDALAVVDPVMGDHGKPYKSHPPALQLRMRDLVREADVITPNLTEAAMLLDQDFPSFPITRAQGKSMLVRLSELGPGKVVITGVKLATGEMANIGYDREKNAFWAVDCDYVPVSYPGTGDIFASVLTGGMLTGDSLPMAMDRASRFVELTIKTTFGYGSDTRYGVMLEMCLPELMSREVPHRYHIF
ncbi:pyridoxamine kinase [Zongyangia sp. HA2173]|uniref:pyridoxamine kinase n=1 Tax=Zongyangia sp. HA2173 TaxID=3133035 RepID=UPI003164C046